MVAASNFFSVKISPRPVLARPDFKRSKKVGGGGASPKVLMPKFSNPRACQMRGPAAGNGHGQEGAISHIADLHRCKAGRAADAAAFRQHHVVRSFHTVQP